MLQVLEEMKATTEGPYGKFAKMDAVKQVAIMKDPKGRDEDVRVKTDELQQLHQQLEQAQVLISGQLQLQLITSHAQAYFSHAYLDQGSLTRAVGSISTVVWPIAYDGTK